MNTGLYLNMFIWCYNKMVNYFTSCNTIILIAMILNEFNEVLYKLRYYSIYGPLFRIHSRGCFFNKFIWAQNVSMSCS